jgi:hypothetical protein
MRLSNKLIFILAVVVLYFAFMLRPLLRKGSKSQTTPFTPDAHSSGKVFEQTQEQTPNSKPSHSVNRETAWSEFRQGYGNDLEADFTSDGRVASIQRSALDSQAPSSPVTDKASAIARAQKILSDASSLLGLNPSFPLQAHEALFDEISSRVDFVQTKDGVPFAPAGRVTVQMDSQGRLKSLYSDYINDPVIANSGSFSQGNRVYFVEGRATDGQSVPVLQAYQSVQDGKETITDASTGKILLQRDRRQY